MWYRYQAASWQDAEALLRRMAGNEQALRRELWRKLKREAAALPFLEDILTAYYCAFDRQTPLYVKGVLMGAIAYFVLPNHWLPKYIPMLIVDDAAIVAAAIKAVSSQIKPEHRHAAQRTLARLRGERV
jgi:uncharacterized membrane protein YkvA (DUF1232 family)